jgi:hypothetical protein
VRIAVLLGITLFIGCVTTPPPEPPGELSRRMAAIRIVSGPDGARECRFLGNETGTEIPAGRFREGRPAMYFIRREAAILGADTLEITNTEQRYDERWSPKYGGRAMTVTTLTGNAYLCERTRIDQGTVPPVPPVTPGSL